MKAIICAAGLGTRLAPLTDAAPKCLLPVYNQPMIHYALSAIQATVISKVCIVIHPDYAHMFSQVVADGSDYGLDVTYKVQAEPSGVCDAIALCQDFIDGDNFLMLMGDNIIFDDLTQVTQDFESGCNILLTQVQDPRRFGVADFDENNKLINLIEKPENPPSNFAWTGVALFDSKFFEYAKNIELSPRGEFETNDVIQQYIQAGTAECQSLVYPWFDAGTHHDLVRASSFVKSLVDTAKNSDRQHGSIADLATLRKAILINQ